MHGGVRGTVLWGARGARDAGNHDGARSCGPWPHVIVILLYILMYKERILFITGFLRQWDIRIYFIY